MKLESETALITGASSGIGEEFAHQLARRGSNLILVARREDRLNQLRDQLLALKPGLVIDVIGADLSKPGSAADLAAKVTGLGRRVGILINNAGVGQHGDFAAQTVEAHSAQIQLNCVSLVELTALFLPAMKQAGRGLIINVGSTAGFQPMPTMAVYGATKAFVLSFTEAVWQETKSTGVRVFVLCPGATETEFFARTGKEFLTAGRQTSKQVVDAAMTAIERSAPTVFSGWRNAISSNGYRVLPRRVMPAITQLVVKAR
jgi:short-subunit dehydrogenase